MDRSTYLNYLIEHGLFVSCPLLDTDRFITYCTERGLRVDKRQLEQLEQLGIFYPMARVRQPLVKYKVQYTEDGHCYYDLGRLEEGEEWSGDTIEQYADFRFTQRIARAWLAEGWIWEPASREFEPWDSFSDKVRHQRHTQSFYSVFQCDALRHLLQSIRRHTVSNNWLVTQTPEAITERIRQLSAEAEKQISTFKAQNPKRDLSAYICQIISNRYFPLTQTDRRTIQISGHYDDEWEHYARDWDAKAVLTDLNISPEDLKQLQERIARIARKDDPLEYWYELVSFISVEQKKSLKDKALLAQTFYSMEHMLRLFYEDFTGTKLYAPGQSPVQHPDQFYGEGVTRDELMYLELLTNRFHLNPKPQLILLVEGYGEEDQYPLLIEKLFGFSLSQLGIELYNIYGVSGFIGKKYERYGALERFIDSYHYRHTLVFLILDNDKRVLEVKKNLVKAYSKFSSSRRVTRDEYIHVWNTCVEFDNFSHIEIAQAMTELGKNQYVFTVDEIAECEATFVTRNGDTLSKLYKEKLDYELAKTELLKILFGYIYSDIASELDESGRPKRPIGRVLQKVIELASHNPQPITRDVWEQNQQSGYFGQPIKPVANLPNEPISE